MHSRSELGPGVVMPLAATIPDVPWTLGGPQPGSASIPTGMGFGKQ
jgi:hypothetical protein